MITLYDLESYPLQPLQRILAISEESNTRLEAARLLLKKGLLTNISSNALQSQEYGQNYLLQDRVLEKKLKNLYPDLQFKEGQITRLDAVLAICATPECYTCLEEEGGLYGYRQVDLYTLPNELIIVILHNIKSYDTLLTFYSLNQFTRNYIVTHISEISDSYLKNNVPLKEPNWLPKTFSQLLTWIKGHFYTPFCASYLGIDLCLKSMLAYGDLDLFLQHENSLRNHLLPKRAVLITEYCTLPEIEYLIDRLKIDMRAEILLWIPFTYTQKELKRFILNMLSNQPLVVVERTLVGMLFREKLNPLSKIVYKKILLPRKLEKGDNRFFESIFRDNLNAYWEDIMQGSDLSELIYPFQEVTNNYQRIYK